MFKSLRTDSLTFYLLKRKTNTRLPILFPFNDIKEGRLKIKDSTPTLPPSGEVGNMVSDFICSLFHKNFSYIIDCIYLSNGPFE